MENNNVCPICGTIKKLIPAGISRTSGKPYDQFWACPNKCRSPQNVNYVGKPNRQEEIKKAIEHKDKRIDEFVDRKETSIDAWAAINNATILVAEMLKNPAVFQNSKEIVAKIKELAGGIRDVAKAMKRETVFLEDSMSQTSYERTSEIEAINGEL